MPKAIAAAYHPIHVKASMRIEAPTQWVGGCLANLYKGKGSTTGIENHRDATVACTDGKQFGSHLRTNLIAPMRELIGQSQYGGGFNGASCDMAHLHVTEPLAFAMLKNKSAAIIFLDLVAAIASLKRCLAVPCDEATNEEWRQQLVRSGFSVEEATEVINLACNALR